MGTSDEDERKALREQLATLTAAVQALTLGQARPESTVTFNDVAKRYFKRVSRKIRWGFGPLLAHFGELRVMAQRRPDWLHFRDDVRGDLGVGTRNQDQTLMFAMLRWAVAHEVIPANPFEGVKKLKGQRARETEIDPIEHAAAFARAPLLIRVFQACCVETGMRNGCEVLHMERSHIDRARSVIEVPRMNAKGKITSRKVPMSDYLRSMLDELPEVLGTPYVFANPATKLPYSAAYLGRLSRPYLDQLKPAAGDRRVVTHDGRHGFVSRLVRGGLHPFASMKVSGHKTASQHYRYTHVSDHDRTKAKNILDAARKSPHRAVDDEEIVKAGSHLTEHLPSPTRR